MAKRSSFSCFHLIGFPSEWGAPPAQEPVRSLQKFPFNWVPQRVGSSKSSDELFELSISLEFPFNWVPQRVGSYELCLLNSFRMQQYKFPFNWVPQRVGSACEEVEHGS